MPISIHHLIKQIEEENRINAKQDPIMCLYWNMLPSLDIVRLSSMGISGQWVTSLPFTFFLFLSFLFSFTIRLLWFEKPCNQLMSKAHVQPQNCITYNLLPNTSNSKCYLQFSQLTHRNFTYPSFLPGLSSFFKNSFYLSLSFILQIL